MQELEKREKLCTKVREMCKDVHEDFLFIVDGKSCWSIKNNEHIKDVACYHKKTENNVNKFN